MNVLEVVAPGAGVGVAEVVADLGDGPPVVLLHGVGFGPASLAPVASVVAEVARVLVLRRPRLAPGAPLEAQAAAVAAVVADRLGPVPYSVAGVSGGATLALALGMEPARPVRAVIAHEPLLGRHAAALWESVRDAHRRLTAGELSEEAWFEGLVGTGPWARLDPTDRAGALTAHADLAAEVAPFASWHPGPTGLAVLRTRPVVTTLGADSGPVRAAAADAVHRHAGAEVIVVPGAAHLVQFDAPAAFGALVARTATEVP